MDLLNVDTEIVIPATPDAVWAVVSDLTSHPRLGGSGEVQSLRVLDEGPLRVGMRFVATEVVHVGPKVFELPAVTSSVVAVEAGRLLRWQTDSPSEFGKPTVKLIEWSFELRPVAEGTTLRHTIRIVMTSAWVTPFFKPLYSLMRGKKVARGMSETLRRISAEVTSAAPTRT